MLNEELHRPNRGSLERAAHIRFDEAALSKAWADPNTLVVRVSAGMVWVNDAGVPVWQRPAGNRSARVFFLGTVDGSARFVELYHERPAPNDESAGTWAAPITVLGQLDDAERETLTVAMALANWHLSAGFAPATGEATEVIQAGWARVDGDGVEHFPRTDPAVIVLIEHENRVLLGSNVLWPQGRFSLLAGFVEAGESAEQAVVREVFEESGVRLGGVHYVASQSWPFPRSLMLGFRATLAQNVDPQALAPDPQEISELRWFSREELTRDDTGVMLPGQVSIAGKMLQQWIAAGDAIDTAPASTATQDALHQS